MGLVTQSGGVAVAVQKELGRLDLGVSTAVSTGDKYDVSGNDMLLWWHGDERTRLAVLHLESFGNPRKFSRFARRLAERMPVLTVRSGSSAAGQRAAASHTAATATPRVTRDALFQQAGVLAVDRLDELSELVATLSWQPLPAGRRTAVISNAGGAGVLAADACEAHGLAVSPLSDRTQRALRRLLPRDAATINPVDTTAVVPSEVFASAISALRADPEVDAVIAVTVATALADPFDGIADAARRGSGTPRGGSARATGACGRCTGARDGQDGARLRRHGDPPPARSRRRPSARSGSRGRGAPADRSPASMPCGPGVSWPVSSPSGRRAAGLEPAQVQDVLESFGLPILRSALAEDPGRGRCRVRCG